MKKLKLKNFTKLGIFIFGICLFLTNCEKQDNEITNEQQSIEQLPKSKIEKLSLDELSNDEQFQEISNAFKLDGAFISAKTTLTKNQTLDDNGFEIDFSSTKKVSTTLGDSYTFLIKNKDSTTFDNLVVEKTKDGKVRGFIMHYEYSQRYLDSLKKGILLPFEGSLKQTLPKDNLGELQELFKNKKEAKTSTSKSAGLVCVETTVIVESKCPTGTHSNGQYCNVTNSIWYGYAHQTYIDCVSTSNGYTNTWGWIAESSSYSTTVPDPNVTSGGGTYSTTATVEPNLFDDVEDIQSFVNFYGLEGDEIEWARYRPNRNIVYGFMEENDYSPDAKAFVKDAVESLVNNTNTLTFNEIIIALEYEQDYRNRMSSSELVILNSMSRIKQLGYLFNGQKATWKAEELFPNSLNNGPGDAFRHAYFNGLNAILLGVNLTESLATAHEDKPFTYPNHFKEKQMDLFNNEVGRAKKDWFSDGYNSLTESILDAMANGELRYLSNLLGGSSSGEATNNSQLTPTN